MTPLSFEQIKLTFNFSDYINTPVKKLPLIPVKAFSYEEKEFFNIRIDLLSLLLGDISFFNTLNDKNNILKGNVVNFNNHRVVSTTTTFYPEYNEEVIYKADKENISLNDFLLGNDSLTFNLFKILKNSPAFLYNLSHKYSNPLFTFLFDQEHVDNIFEPVELFKDVNGVNDSSSDAQMIKFKISHHNRASKTDIKAEILLNYFDYININNIKPSPEDKKYFNKFMKTFIGNYYYPKKIVPLFDYFNNENLYFSPSMFRHFTLNFCKPYWDEYNKQHKIKNQVDLSFKKFSTFMLFFAQENIDIALKRKALSFLCTLSYNQSLFLEKNKDLLVDIYKKLKLKQPKKTKDNCDVVYKIFEHYYREKTFLLTCSKIENTVLSAFLELFKSMNIKLNFRAYSDYVVKQIIDTNDISLLDKKPYIHLLDKSDPKYDFQFQGLRIHALSSLLNTDNKKVFLETLIRIENQTTKNNDEKSSVCNSYIFNYLFNAYFLNENTDSKIIQRMEQCLVNVLRNIPVIDDKYLIGSLKRDKSSETIKQMDIQLEKFKLLASLNTDNITTLKNKRL